MTIEIRNIIGSSNAITNSSGDLLYNELAGRQKDEVVIDFNNILLVSTAFLNASIGKLAVKYPEFLKRISFVIPDDKKIIKLKIDKVIESERNRVSELEAIRTAADALYATLSADQKKTADTRIQSIFSPGSLPPRRDNN